MFQYRFIGSAVEVWMWTLDGNLLLSRVSTYNSFAGADSPMRGYEDPQHT